MPSAWGYPMRSAVQLFPGALHVDRTPMLHLCRGPGSGKIYSCWNSNKLDRTNALKRWTQAECWLFPFLVLCGFAFAQQPSQAIPSSPQHRAPTFQQTLDEQRLAANSLTQLRKIALPRVGSSDPRSPLSAGCANSTADLADRRWRAEWTVGERLTDDLAQHVALISDPAVTDYLNRLEESIVLNSHLHGCFIVKLVNDVEANAYSFPGGFLFVTSGMILNAENEAQLVAALAHETGHVIARHLTRIESQARIWRRLALAGGPAGYALCWRLGPLFNLKLLRNAEFEADRSALEYTSASGYDPIEFVYLLQDAFRHEGQSASFLVRLFDSHPSTETRIKGARQAISRQPWSQMYRVDTSEFHDIKGHVADLMKVANPDRLPRKRLDSEAPSGRAQPRNCQFCQ